MHLLLITIAALTGAGEMDFPALDAAIARCEREAVLPVFAAEAQRRSTFATAAYQEQAQISGERLSLAGKRRALRETTLKTAAAKAAAPAESDQELALAQLALEDRRRALDDRRRLEDMRQAALDMKRQYFLAQCPTPKKKA